MLAFAATSIAMGANSAVAAMFPGPIMARSNPSPKKTMGIAPALPRDSLSENFASLSSVPFTRACENKQCDGNKRKKERNRKARRYFRNLDPGKTQSNNKGKSERKKSDVQA